MCQNSPWHELIRGSMLCNISHIEGVMAKGDSGRVVVEIDPKLKRELYSALAIDGQTLKDWFIAAAENFVVERSRKVSRAVTKGKSQP